MLLPQQDTVPPRVRAQTCCAPTERLITFEAFDDTGEVLLVLFPFPNWPLELSPQQLTMPLSARKAQLKLRPVPTEVILARPVTRTCWLSKALVVPLPSWPKAFSPQQCTVPSSGTAQV